VITCMSRDKHRWSGPGRELVDDRQGIRFSRENAGQTFVLYRTAAASIAALEKHGF